MRVQPDHWSILLDFCEKNPEIITNKFKGPKGREHLAQKWAELTVLLNSLGLGEKNTEEWKKTVIDWKSKTKAKAASISTYQGGTGGGPSSNVVLNSFEERLIGLMGKVAVHGNPGINEIGIKRSHKSGDSETGPSKIQKVDKPILVTISKGQCKPYKIENLLVHRPPNAVNLPSSLPHDSGLSTSLLTNCAGNSSTSTMAISLENTCDKEAEPRMAGQLDNQQQSTPQRTASTRRRGNNPQISEQLQAMNNDVLAVLNNINNNISQIGRHLADLIQVIKDFKK